MSETPSPGSWIRPAQAKADLVAAIVLLALGAGFLVAIAPLDLGQSDMPGPGMFPAILATSLVLVSLAMIWQCLRRRAQAADDVPLGHTYSMIAALTLLAVTVTFERIGFPLASFAMLAILTRTFARSGWLATLLFAGLTSAASFLIFTRVFAVALPVGTMFTG